MFYASLRDAAAYRGIPALARALDWLNAQNGVLPKQALSLGSGALVVPLSNCLPPDSLSSFSAHRRTVILHFVCRGTAALLTAPAEALAPAGSIDEAADSALYCGQAQQRITLRAGDFSVLMPGEAYSLCPETAAAFEGCSIQLPLPQWNVPSREILLLGDSNTYGYAPATNGRYDGATRWPRALQALLGGDTLVTEEGLPGRTAVFDDPITEGMSALALATPLAMSHAPLDTIVILLGTNDCKERFGCNAYLIGEGMARLIEKLYSTACWRGAPDVLLVAPSPIVPAYRDLMFHGAMGDGCDKKASALGPIFHAVAERTGCRFWDAASVPGVSVSPLDGMHLTGEAHLALAKALVPYLSGLEAGGEIAPR